MTPRNAREDGLGDEPVFLVKDVFFKIIFVYVCPGFLFIVAVFFSPSPSLVLFFEKNVSPAPLTTIFCGLAGAPQLWGGQPTKWHPWLSPRGTVGLRNFPKTESVVSVVSLYKILYWGIRKNDIFPGIVCLIGP